MHPTTATKSPPVRSVRAGLLAPLAMLATLVALTGCGKDEPPPEKRLVVIDGIEITFDDLQPYYDMLEKYRPELGVKSKYVWAMREHVLPLRVAQRAFPKERAVQLQRAEALCSVAGNITELEEQSKLIEHKRRSNLTRANAKLPVALFLFEDKYQTNAVSPPIELPAGYFVVGGYEYHESQLRAADYVDTLQVGFITHTSKQWLLYWEETKKTLGDKVTFVHPDYRDDMPPWMKIPKDKQP